jgi:aromatic-L-amino-acid/L-tryptophan decarboxylase
MGEFTGSFAHPLEPDRAPMRAMSEAVVERAVDFVERLPEAAASTVSPERDEIVETMLAAPPEASGELLELLARIDRAAADGVETAGPGYFGWIPGGGIFAAGLAQLYAAVLNRYVTLAEIAPGLAALEDGVVRWLCDVCGLPVGATGVLTSGGSLANFGALVAARHHRLGERIGRGTLYLSEHAHKSVANAARLAGIRSDNVRAVPCGPGGRMDAEAAASAIATDRARGARPFLLVGTAGTTDTGAIDALPDLAALARSEGLWFHVDAAYGGMFRLTERGAARLAGMDQADSVTLDPHKSLFMPYGTGALVVRDPGALRAAHAVDDGHYLQDLHGDTDVPNFADLGLELTRELRGLRLWLPLHLHGVAAFRGALDEKLDLAEMAYERLRAEPALDVPYQPDLTVVAFRLGALVDAEGEAANRRLLDRINRSRRVFLSSTTIEGRFTLRLCVLSHRTHADRVCEAIDLITDAARDASYV